jgi:TolA-binding protein
MDLQSLLNKSFLSLILIILVGCAYFNTFYNAKENYKLGVDKQKKTTSETISSEVKNHFDKAIEKSWKLIDIYGDSSKYADDALLLIGQSYFNLRDYPKAERVFQQFLLKFSSSDLIPEAKLWLAKTYIALAKEDLALDLLDQFFEDKVSNKNAAQTYFILGELYFKRGDDEKAIENLTRCLEITGDDEMRGDAEFMIGESFFRMEEYENAIVHFSRLEKLDVPPVKEFEALMQKINALNELQKYDEADRILRIMLRDQRFKDQFAFIETQLAHIAEIQGYTDYARELYSDVIKKYPRKEGTALASFYLAQLFQFEYGDLDSARTYYDNVKKQYNASTVGDLAIQRFNLLSEYVKIRDRLKKDRQDYLQLLRGDSILTDSIALQPEPVDSSLIDEEQQQNLDFQMAFQSTIPEEADSTILDSLQQTMQASQRDQNQTRTKKIAVTRPPDEVEGSLIKNSYALAEFFLFSYGNYDSAAYAYQKFVTQYEDSVLTPKAYYGLYYLYNDVFVDTAQADSIRDILLSRYRDSIYSKKLLDEEIEDKLELGIDPEELKGKERYLQAENHLHNKNFMTAIQMFNQIAREDSGSVWAKKSRYAVAYIYEHFLEDVRKAIDSFGVLAAEYPNTDHGKIALQKIAEPPVDKEEPPVDNDLESPDEAIGLDDEMPPEIRRSDEKKDRDSSISDEKILKEGNLENKSEMDIENDSPEKSINKSDNGRQKD